MFYVKFDDGDKYGWSGHDITITLSAARKIGREWRQYTIYTCKIEDDVILPTETVLEHLGMDNESNARFQYRIGNWDLEDVEREEAEEAEEAAKIKEVDLHMWDDENF